MGWGQQHHHHHQHHYHHQQQAARELARNQESIARVSNAVATERITSTNRTTHRVQREMVQERYKRHEDRVESVLQLKQVR